MQTIHLILMHSDNVLIIMKRNTQRGFHDEKFANVVVRFYIVHTVGSNVYRSGKKNTWKTPTWVKLNIVFLKFCSISLRILAFWSIDKWKSCLLHTLVTTPLRSFYWRQKSSCRRVFVSVSSNPLIRFPRTLPAHPLKNIFYIF